MNDSSLAEKKKINILHLEDDGDDAELIYSEISDANIDFKYILVNNKKEFIQSINSRNIDLILADHSVYDFDSSAALEIKNEILPDVPLIIVSGTIGEERAVELMINGATDCILKDKLNRLVPSIKRALHENEELKKRKKAEAELEIVNEQLTNIFENLEEVIFSIDLFTYRLLQISSSCEKVFGYAKEVFEENPFFWKDIVYPDDVFEFDEKLKNIFEGENFSFQYRIIKNDGKVRWVENKIKPVTDDKGNIIRIDAMVSDITERILIEQERIESLKQKDMLLKEINHRVKNNLQIVSSLLKLQAASIKDREFYDIFKDTQNRVLSMSFIHQQLYQSTTLSKVNLHDYVEKLVFNLLKVYGFESRNIAVSINALNINLDVDTAVPCGLLINEIVSNSFKYAFPNGIHGELNINCKYIGNSIYELNISDNGIGIPPEFKNEESKTLGTQLIYTLVEQLDGKMEINSDRGTHYKIVFSSVKYRERI